MHSLFIFLVLLTIMSFYYKDCAQTVVLKFLINQIPGELIKMEFQFGGLKKNLFVGEGGERGFAR